MTSTHPMKICYEAWVVRPIGTIFTKIRPSGTLNAP